jgi:PhnB protein
MTTIQAVFPYLRVQDARAAIAFYTQAFGAKELFRLVEPASASSTGGRIGHAELQLGPTVLMLSDAFPEYGMAAPSGENEIGCALHLHVSHADTVCAAAVAAGGMLLMAPADMFYGERSGRVRDPFGHTWIIGHEIEKLSPQEMQRRYDSLS